MQFGEDEENCAVPDECLHKKTNTEYSPSSTTPIYSMSSCSTPIYSMSSCSTPIYTMSKCSTPICSTPICPTPIYLMPIYLIPIRLMPICSMPIYSTPTYKTPIYSTSGCSTTRCSMSRCSTTRCSTQAFGYQNYCTHGIETQIHENWKWHIEYNDSSRQFEIRGLNKYETTTNFKIQSQHLQTQSQCPLFNRTISRPVFRQENMVLVESYRSSASWPPPNIHNYYTQWTLIPPQPTPINDATTENGAASVNRYNFRVAELHHDRYNNSCPNYYAAKSQPMYSYGNYPVEVNPATPQTTMEDFEYQAYDPTPLLTGFTELLKTFPYIDTPSPESFP